MAQPVRYQFEQRSEGRGAVVRVNQSGTRRVIAVYRDQGVADRIARTLDGVKEQEQ